MPRRRNRRISIKRRKNPPKKDGTQTVSLTLRYYDGDGHEKFYSLGPGTAPEQAEDWRRRLEHDLISPWSDDPSYFAKQFLVRHEAAFKVLSEYCGLRFFPAAPEFNLKKFVEGFLIAKWRNDCPPDVLASEMLAFAADLHGDKWMPEPRALLWQFRNRYPEEYQVLRNCFEYEFNRILDHVERLRLSRLPSHVVAELFALAEEWEWSGNPDKFSEQFAKALPLRVPTSLRQGNQTRRCTRNGHGEAAGTCI